MRKGLILISFLVAICAQTANAQDYHFIQFSDKDTTLFGDPSSFLSQKSLDRRTKQGIPVLARDYPVLPAYIDSIEATGVIVINTTKWLNGALISVNDPSIIPDLLEKPYVLKESMLIEQYGGTAVKEFAVPFKPNDELDYGAATNQIEMLELDVLHQEGYTGKGISIAVFDAGFPRVNTLTPFEKLRTENRLKYAYSYVKPDENIFTLDERNQHGLNVFSIIGAYADGAYIGAAFDADFYLFETEDVTSESPVEELNWLFAAERADSLGVDIINSSLGYNEFDNSAFDFEHADLDGERAIVTQAADIAAEVGMLVVCSAGNEGDETWRKITPPADGDFVLAVGAVDQVGVIANYSSVGPSADGRTKPDIVAQGSRCTAINSSGSVSTRSGTSFSAPLIAGFAACLWQAEPNLTSKELLNKIRMAGDRADNPDGTYGYGIPTYSNYKSNVVQSIGYSINPFDGILAFPNPIERNYLHLELPEAMLNKWVEIMITDATGKKYFNKKQIVNQSIVDIKIGNQKLPAGMYILHLSYKDHVKSIQLIAN